MLGTRAWLAQKTRPRLHGYTGRKWTQDYGIVSGTCNREAAGAAIGAIVGNVVGSQVGKGDGRVIATILGTVAGSLIGAKVGRDMDKVDHACLGHALELAKDNKPVRWSNPDSRVDYLVTPQKGFTRQGRQCREFTTRITFNSQTEMVPGKACQKSEGVWEMMN